MPDDHFHIAGPEKINAISMGLDIQTILLTLRGIARIVIAR